MLLAVVLKHLILEKNGFAAQKLLILPELFQLEFDPVEGYFLIHIIPPLVPGLMLQDHFENLVYAAVVKFLPVSLDLDHFG